MTDFKQECLDNFNKIGLFCGCYPIRVIGYLDSCDDNYLIGLDFNGERSYWSMVGGFDPLAEGSEYTERNWATRAPPAKEFIHEVERCEECRESGF